ncbi:MAG: hypothetical protein V5B38_02425 [Candidatus Accumulibacter propinquus]
MNQLTLPYHFERRRPTPLRWSHWYLSILKLAVGLLLVLLITLLWLLHRNEIDEQRSTLIADVLWLEQSLRFHLDGNSEQLQQLALDLTRASDRANSSTCAPATSSRTTRNSGSCCGWILPPGRCTACRRWTCRSRGRKLQARTRQPVA